jgi:DNA-binding transcriptional LysR family regulator
MLTIKQIETFYWVAKLGTVERAANKLHITQSAATKRLQDVEANAAARLFERNGKKSRLSPKGYELLALCERLLDSIESLQTCRDADRHRERPLRIGLTELVALTWFPAFARALHEVYPNILLQPQVDMSGALQDQLIDGRLDFAILPEPELPESIVRVKLGYARFAWFCAPGRFDTRRTVPLRDLAAFPVIEQAPRSIVTILGSKSFEKAGIDPERICGGNNAVAIGGLVAAGVGVSCLPVALLERQLKGKLIQIVRTDPPAPGVRYDAVFPKHPHAALGYDVAEVARRYCDLSRAA